MCISHSVDRPFFCRRAGSIGACCCCFFMPLLMPHMVLVALSGSLVHYAAQRKTVALGMRVSLRPNRSLHVSLPFGREQKNQKISPLPCLRVLYIHTVSLYKRLANSKPKKTPECTGEKNCDTEHRLKSKVVLCIKKEEGRVLFALHMQRNRPTSKSMPFFAGVPVSYPPPLNNRIMGRKKATLCPDFGRHTLKSWALKKNKVFVVMTDWGRIM